jgi:hypothetical protein
MKKSENPGYVREPDMQYDIYVSVAGVQVDLFYAGEHQQTYCRDFAGSFGTVEKRKELLRDLNRRIMKVVNDWKNEN